MNEYGQLRSQTYLLFAGLLDQAISESQWAELVAWAEKVEGSGFLAALQQWILDNALLDKTGIQTLAADFTRLFTGLAEEYGPKPPYAHLYREDVEQENCRAAITQCYSNHNLVPLDPYRNTSDHIVAELQYMALLAAQQATQKTEYSLHKAAIVSQLSFLNTHLLTWVIQWQQLIASQNSRLAFYAKITEALVYFLQQDLKFLSSHNCTENWGEINKKNPQY